MDEKLIIEKTFDDVNSFYKASMTLTKDGNRSSFKEEINTEKIDFRGLSISEIYKSRFSYKEGLDQLKEIESDDYLIGTRKYKYDESDGDDINYDRLLDGFPALIKRVRGKVKGIGRIINIYVNIAEACYVSYKQMIHKAHTVIRLVDMLEEMGYRVCVYSCAYAKEVGRLKGKEVDIIKLNVCIKRPEEPIIKSLLMTCISPWFFRYYIFCYYHAICFTYGWLGSPLKFDKKSTNENIYIDNEECLNEKTANKKIEEIKKLFSLEYEQEYKQNVHL